MIRRVPLWRSIIKITMRFHTSGRGETASKVTGLGATAFTFDIVLLSILYLLGRTIIPIRYYSWSLKFHKLGKPFWSNKLPLLDRALDCLAAATSSAHRPRVSVHRGIVDLWEKSLEDRQSHDLTLETADGQVTAHSHMLAQASPVVRAMLASPLKEGKARRIEVKDVSSSGVCFFLETLVAAKEYFLFLHGLGADIFCLNALFVSSGDSKTLHLSTLDFSGQHLLRILYTCSTKGDPDYRVALQALDVAHRWQVEVVVTVLTGLLEGMISDESFAEIADHAVLKASKGGCVGKLGGKRNEMRC